MAAQIFQLTMRSGPAPGEMFPLEKEEIFLGRDLANDIQINDPEVSRRHARFVMQAGGIVIEDLGSTNGTFVNGKRISTARSLSPGDVITFGENVVMVFERPSFDPDATVVAAQSPQAAPTEYQQPEPPKYQQPPQPAAHQQPTPQPQSYGEGPQQIPAQQSQEKKGFPAWLIVLIIAIVALACVIAVTLWFMPASWWCAITFDMLEGCPIP